MSAFADRCPECGKFIPKGSVTCASCGWAAEAEVRPATAAAAEPTEPKSMGVGRALATALVGALLAAIALTAGAGDVGTVPDGPGASQDGGSPIAGEAPRPSESVPAQTPSAEAEPAEPVRTDPALSAEARAELRRAIAAIRDELAEWAELYRIPHGDVADLQGRLTELEESIEQIPGRKE